MRNIIGVAACAAAAFAVPAAAQDSDRAPFDGVYVGGSLGLDMQSSDRDSTILFDRNLDGSYNDTVLTGAGANAFSPGFCGGAANTANASAGCRSDRDAVGYSGRIGWDKQMGALVVGVVGEFGTSNITDSTSGFSTTPANYVFTRKVDWEGSVRGRAGFAANNTLFYGAFGPSYVKLDNSFSSSQSTNTFTGSGRSKEWGITGGGGIEQKIGRNFSIGVEYLYHQYNDDRYRVRVAGGPANTPFTNTTNGGNALGTDLRRSDDRFRWHSARVTAAYHF